MKRIHQFILTCLFVPALMTSSFLRGSSATPQDAVDLQQQAKQSYYTVLPQSCRRVNGTEQFLITVDDPSQEEVATTSPGCRLVLAERTQKGSISIIWQYRLSTTHTALRAIWCNGKSYAKNSIFVYLDDGTCSTLHVDGNLPPVPTNNFRVKSANGTMVLSRNRFFIALSASGEATIFFSDFALLTLGLDNGKTQIVYQVSGLHDNFSQYLAAEDLDGDGTTDIVGDTSLVQFVKGKVIRSSGIVRVWHDTLQGFQQIYASAPRRHWAIESAVAPMGTDKKLVIAANELSEAADGVSLYLHLYCWNGSAIQEIATSEGILPPLNHDGFTFADLSGQGGNSILASVTDKENTIHLSVLKLVNDKMVKVWTSPPMDGRLRFGRVSNYDNVGKQEVPLINTDTQKVSLFKQVGATFTGWEALRYVPPPPPPPKPLEERFAWQQEDGLKPADPARNFLMLDGAHLILVPANDREINALYRVQQVQQRISDLAKQSFPAAQVVARKAGDQDEEPKREVVAGKIVIITLTESKAKTAGKPLAAYAQEWVAAVKTVLTTLAVPPK